MFDFNKNWNNDVFWYHVFSRVFRYWIETIIDKSQNSNCSVLLPHWLRCVKYLITNKIQSSSVNICTNCSGFDFCDYKLGPAEHLSNINDCYLVLYYCSIDNCSSLNFKIDGSIDMCNMMQLLSFLLCPTQWLNNQIRKLQAFKFGKKT